MKRSSGLVLALLLSACKLGPDYQRPEVVVPQGYRWQAQDSESGSFGDLGWWEVYQDPTLQSLVRQAFENNLDLQIAAARVDQARASLGSTGLAQLPQISGSGGITRSRTSEYKLLPLPGVTPYGTTDTLQLNISYDLDFWGRYRRATEAARAQLLATQYAQQNVLVGLVANVATAYFNLVSFDEQLDITHHTLDTRQTFVQLTRARHERGVVSGLDVANAESQLATAEANVPDLERQIAQTEDQLSVLLGKNPDAITRSVREGVLRPIPPVPPAGLPAQLLERRPDVRQAEQSLVAANANVGVAKAALFPSISLTAAGGVTSGTLSKLFSGPAQTWSVGVGLLQPLLDAQRNLYQVDLADAQKREAILQYQKTVQNAFQEVSDALIARQKYAEFQEAQAAQVAALQRAADIALARYRIGYSSYFDVINADRDLFGAKLTLSAAYRNTLLAAVQLYRALGGGWQMENAAAAPPGKG